MQRSEILVDRGGIKLPTRHPLTHTLATWAVTLFCVATVILPASSLNKVMFVLVMLFALGEIIARGGRVRLDTLSSPLIAGVFAYGFMLSLGGGADLELSRQFMLSALVLTTIYVVRWYRIDFDRVVLICGIAICMVTAVAFAILVNLAGSAASDWFLVLFSQYLLGAWGSREFLSSPATMFSLGTVPFLFAVFCVLVERLMGRIRLGTVLFLGMVLVVVVASTSRGLVLACLLVATIAVIRRSSPAARLAVTAAVLVGALTLLPFLLSSTEIFSADEASNAIRVGHFRSFFDNLYAWRFLFGQGLGAYYYTSGRNMVLPHTEVTALDLARYVGVPLATVVFLALIVPAFKGVRIIGPAGIHIVYFFIYLFLAQTNPVLINSCGFLVVVWYWSHVLAERSTEWPKRPRV